MYGVVAGQKQGKLRTMPAKEQSVEEKVVKKSGFTARILHYVRERFHSEPVPPRSCSTLYPRVCGNFTVAAQLAGAGMEEECEEATLTPSRHRPEGVSALAQSTRFTAHEIKLMYRGFKQECPTGVVDEDAFKHIFSQFFPLGDASQYAHYVFNTVKHKQSGKLNFEEFLEILSRVARGSVQDKLAWVFALYDVDGDGRISRHEMEQVVHAIYELVGRAAVPPVTPLAAREHAHRIFGLMDANADGVVTPDELAQWVARDPHALRSLATLDTVL